VPMERMLDAERQRIKEHLLRMGGLVEAMIDIAIQAALRHPADTDAVWKHEDEVNALHVDIDDKCFKSIALRQPAAADLRFLLSALKINGDLERMGDHATNIAQDAQFLAAAPALPPMDDIVVIADRTKRIVTMSLDAFVQMDVALARSVIAREEEIDHLKAKILKDLLVFIAGNPALANHAVDIILIARNFERIGDHATNIAEEVIFMVLGKDIRHNVEKKDRSTPYTP